MAKDKRLHLICGCIIALIIGLYSPLAGFVAGAIAGALKELYDYACYGGPDVYDFLATVAGAAIGAGIAMYL